MQYQEQMRNTYCPVPPPAPDADPEEAPKPFCFDHFDKITELCVRYVNGDPNKGPAEAGGAASHLVDQCIAALEKLLKNPASLLQRNKDGSFFTEVPTEIWSVIHEHLSLASATKSAVLHVLMADKVGRVISDVKLTLPPHTCPLPLAYSASLLCG